MTANATLRERVEALQLVNQWVQEEAAANEGLLPDWLEELQWVAEYELKQKIEKVGMRILTLRGEVEQLQQEQERIVGRIAARQNSLERLKQYAEATLRDADVRKVETPLITMYLQKNSPAVTGSVPEGLLMDWYNFGGEEGMDRFVRRVPAQYQLDRKAVLDAHKKGYEIPDGLQVVQGESLRVR